MKKYLIILTMLFFAACSKTSNDTGTTPPPPPPPPATPVVSFTFTVNADQYPVTVSFSNTSTGYTSFNWDLGTSTSTATSPSGLYNTSDLKYTIKLVASNGTKTDSTKTDITIPPLNRSVRMFYIIPTDKVYVQANYDAIVNNANTIRQWYSNQLGKTFKLNNPVVKVVYATITSANFINTPGPTGSDPNSYFLYNSLAELKNAGIRNPANDDNYIYNVFTPVANPLGWGVWTIGGLRAAGIPDFGLGELTSGNTGNFNLGMGLWCHELGHSFGLNHPNPPDPTTIMTPSANNYPGANFQSVEKTTVLADGFMF